MADRLRDVLEDGMRYCEFVADDYRSSAEDRAWARFACRTLDLIGMMVESYVTGDWRPMYEERLPRR